MFNKYTKGEWKLIDDGASFIIEGPGTKFGHDHSTDKTKHKEVMQTPAFIEQKANAQLMAAAKDLYKALVELRRAVSTKGLADADAAIKKAEGKM